jgi:glycosyltransferase involved in cell wall biosynthesis
LREGFEEVVKCVASRKEMVDRIVELLDSPESIKTLGMKATRFVEEHHSWRCTAEAYERIYRGGAP